MVLQLRAAKLAYSTQFLKEVLEYQYGLPKASLKKYVRASHVASILGITEHAYVNRVTESKKYHGIYVEGAVYMHPKCATEQIKESFKLRISRVVGPQPDSEPLKDLLKS